MTNYASRFIHNYADIGAPLRDLTHKGVEFKWQEAYFDPHKKTVLFVDASPVGLGAMLTQSGKVISYTSKALSGVERRYSQIEREALAIAWGCHHFRMHWGLGLTMAT